MKFISGPRTALPQGAYSQISQYRHRVFVERLGWDLETWNDEEVDQFDRPDTVYVAAHSGDRVVGCARLLPTTRPYLLGEIFAGLLHGTPPPHSPDIWELSRFAAVDVSGPATPFPGQFSSPVAVQLLRESMAYAVAHGASRLITVSPVGVERLLRMAGFRAYRVAPPRLAGGQPVIACLIETV